jgi:CHAT domain-containing protein
MRFGPLPDSAREAQAITTLWERTNGKPVQHLNGREATEAAFKQEAPGKRVLHLATHGFFLDDRCASALEKQAGPGAPGAPSVTGENPLLLSGLVLAGANNRGTAGALEEDGILTAEEIAALDLSGVEWAVLSACDTGLGKFKAGEGVFGLRRAFQVAGVRTVVMSLWPVQDQATRTWMTALYDGRFAKRLDTATAAHQASTKVLTERRGRKQSTHPFYWAGFVAAGDWR